jgi:SNF2 family DNA or RNA helicase
MQLYPFQAEGVQFILSRPGTLLADEMGLGKSAQTIGVLNADPSSRRVLIVCPASMRIPWRRELEKWLERPMTVGVIGVDRESISTLCEREIVIINYDRLHSIAGWLTDTVFDLAVLDECHLCKNPSSRRSKIATSIIAARRLALSGTPLQNRPVELRPILSWLSPAAWAKKEWHAFGQRYCGAFWDGFAWNENGATNLTELSQRLRATVMLRRLKANVLEELPPKTRQIIELSVSAQLSSLVESEWKEFTQGVALHVDYSAIDWDDLARLRHAVALAKAPLAISFITEVLASREGKLVVFAHHRDVVQMLKEG